MAPPGNVGILSRKRPPQSLKAVRSPAPEEVAAQADGSSWCLTDEEDMGQSGEQTLIIKLLSSCLEELARERGWERVLISSDQFFAWIPGAPLVRVSPDVYLLDDPPPLPLPLSWQTWKHGHRAPRFAVEIVSGDDRRSRAWRKDYDDAPAKYAQLGTKELVIFDPEAAAGRTRRQERVALQLYRREEDGGFVQVHAGPGPVFSRELQIWLFVLRDGEVARLRLARDEALQDWVPTEAERAEQERRRAEAAERELARLRAHLARLERKE